MAHFVALLLVYLAGGLCGIALTLIGWARSNNRMSDELRDIRRMIDPVDHGRG